MSFSRRTGILGAAGGLAAALTGCSAASPATSPSGPASSAGVPTTAEATPSEATPSAEASPSPSASQPPAQPAPPPKPWAGVPSPLPSGPVNVLIVGTDNNTNSGNTDVLVVAQLSADRTHVTLVGIPRDSYVTLASGGKSKINSALLRGGISNTKATVSSLFGGLKIHYVAQVNFATFIRLCVLLNGFGVINKISSSVTSQVTGKVTRFPKGPMIKYGADWLIYARQRKGLPRGEFDRGERHRAIIIGMTKALKALAGNNPERLVSISQNLFKYVNVYGGIDRENILGLIPHLSTIGWDNFVSLKVPHAAVADAVTLDYGQLGDLASALRKGNIWPYVERYGRN